MRRWRRAVGLILAGLLAAEPAAAASGRAAAAEWTHPGYGPGNNHYNPNESRLNAGTITNLKRRWTVTTPADPDFCTLVGEPLASLGRLFTTDPTGISSYAPRTGRKLWHWTFPVLNPGRANREKFGELTVSGGLVIALTNPCESGAGQHAYLTAIDAATGVQKWRVTMDQYTTIMVVDKGVAAVGNWGGFADNPPQSATGYRVSDGAQLWRITDYSLNGGVSAGGRLLLGHAGDNATRAVSITTGKTLWSTAKAWSPRAASPAGDRFLVSTDSTGMTSVDAATGAEQWSTRHGGGLAYDGRRIYVSYHRILETYDAATGRKLRITSLASHGGQPVRAGGLLYVPVGGHPMVVLDPNTGGTVASFPEIRGLGSSPVIVGGWLYTSDGENLRGYAP